MLPVAPKAGIVHAEKQELDFERGSNANANLVLFFKNNEIRLQIQALCHYKFQ
jgi:hypothetical protein